MPFYDYQCDDCKTEISVKATVSAKEEGLEVSCPKCGSQKTHQLFNSMAFIGAGSKQSSSDRPIGPCGNACGCYPQN